jgi:miniconductance mechanosensitive channel
MLSPLREWLIRQGVAESAADLLQLTANVGLVLVLAIITNYVVRRIVVRTVRNLARRTVSHWDEVITRHRVLHKLAHLVPALVIYHFAVPVLGEYPQVMAVVRQGLLIYMIVAAVAAAAAALDAAIEVARSSTLARGLPLRGFGQVARLVLYAAATISVLSLVLGRSPLLLLSGFGAMSAVLLLVFKDAILGFVAGIQLSANQMVARGDWIEMPKHGADGDVVEVGLTTVKVQNWDKTITTIPTYALISESFRNWRGMTESGGRRIKRAINIDMGSIRFCNDEMLSRFSRIEYISDYLKAKREEIAEWNATHNVDPTSVINGRRLTNIGTFRSYVVAYLRNHPMVHQEMTFLVRQLRPTEYGLPLEIYVFSCDQEWANYEALQADIFDHLLAVVPEFDLRVFQSPSGSDVGRLLDSTGRPGTGASV